MSTFTFSHSFLRSPGALDRVLVGLLLAFYVLLPLDRGFPTVPLFGRPLNSAIAATLAVLLVLAVRSRGLVLSYLREPYCVVQSLYACVLFVGALRAPSPPSALHWSLLYYSTFVLNYIILRHVTQAHGRHWLSMVVVALGMAAAAVSIVQGVLGLPLPMYDTWFENYFRSPPESYLLPTSRANGTMSNPILYSMLMALVVPYALDVKNTRVRACALFVAMFAAGLTGSRTVVFIVAVFAAGALVVFRWRAIRALPAVVLGLVLLGASLTWLTPGGGDGRLGFLVQRLTLLFDRSGVSERSKAALNVEARPHSSKAADRPGASEHDLNSRESPHPPPEKIALPGESEPEAQAEVSAVLGISLRRAAVIEGIREITEEWGPVTWAFGRGSFSVPTVGKRIQPWYNTVDNVYLSVLYERGLSGLALFVGAFLALIITTRRAAAVTVHWFAPVAMALAGLSFCWDAYSTFNILAVGSMAMVMWHEGHPDRPFDRRWPATFMTRPIRRVSPASPAPEEQAGHRDRRA